MVFWEGADTSFYGKSLIDKDIIKYIYVDKDNQYKIDYPYQ